MCIQFLKDCSACWVVTGSGAGWGGGAGRVRVEAQGKAGDLQESSLWEMMVPQTRMTSVKRNEVVGFWAYSGGQAHGYYFNWASVFSSVRWKWWYLPAHLTALLGESHCEITSQPTKHHSTDLSYLMGNPPLAITSYFPNQSHHPVLLHLHKSPGMWVAGSLFCKKGKLKLVWRKTWSRQWQPQIQVVDNLFF